MFLLNMFLGLGNAQTIINPLVSPGTNDVTIFGSVPPSYTEQTLRLEVEAAQSHALIPQNTF